MKLAIMQPYFLPYIGYFQLIAAADNFIIYDNIEYTKKGWINRNRMLQNNKDIVFSLPLKKDSDYLHIKERELSDSFNKMKLLNQIRGAYGKAPYFNEVMPLFEAIINYDKNNLFDYIYNSVVLICEYLCINTSIIKSSSVEIDHSLKGEIKVLAFCNKTEAKTYINSIGGLGLYSKQNFVDNRINLKFLQSKPFTYRQFSGEFCPWLSILDVMMFNSKEETNSVIASGFNLN
jgi:hypothetical protein